MTDAEGSRMSQKVSAVDRWLRKRDRPAAQGTFGTGPRLFDGSVEEQGPGPRYYVRETIGDDRPQVSIDTRGKRQFDLAGDSADVPAPGTYSHPREGFQSKEHYLRVHTFPRARRFQQHSTTSNSSNTSSSVGQLLGDQPSRPGDLGSVESSASRFGVGTETPKFSFGLRLSKERHRYFSPELCISTTEGRGPASYLCSEFKDFAATRPAFSLGKGSKMDFTKESTSRGVDIPGPGTYDVVRVTERQTLESAPSVTFGSATREHIPITQDRESSKVLYGVESPGPQYLPKCDVVTPNVHGMKMGNPPPRRRPLKLKNRSRNRNRNQSQSEIEMEYDVRVEPSLPGPGDYNPEKHQCVPSASIAGKEEDVEDIFTNTIHKARFIFGQKGMWSPGPKYMLPSTLRTGGMRFARDGLDRKTVVERLADGAGGGGVGGVSGSRSVGSKRSRRGTKKWSALGPGHYRPKFHLTEKAPPLVSFTDAKRSLSPPTNEVPGPGHYPHHPGLKALSRTRAVRGVPKWYPGPKSGRPLARKTGRDSVGPGRYYPQKSTLRKGGTRFGGLS